VVFGLQVIFIFNSIIEEITNINSIMSKLLKKKKKKKLNPDEKRFYTFGSWGPSGIINLINLMIDNFHGGLSNTEEEGIKGWSSFLKKIPINIINLKTSPFACSRSDHYIIKCKEEKQCSVCIKYNGRYIGINNLLKARSCFHNHSTEEQIEFQEDLEKACLADHEWANRTVNSHLR